MLLEKTVNLKKEFILSSMWSVVTRVNAERVDLSNCALPDLLFTCQLQAASA